ncbi:PRC-barrel domain-containing protein [Synechococcus sp. CS-1324]|nr:PRC-barrel domain-containing protein [Synechococcus sp. CS-1324]PZV04056.1 MAG: photosystem reaction center subunit H [Cyanobium sp.]
MTPTTSASPTPRGIRPLTSSIPPSTDPARAVPSDRLWLRSELMGTQVITRDTGRRLGVVGEVVVDIDRREVMALGLRDNPLTRFLPGLPRWMPLDRIRQVGDVILVDSVDSLTQSFNPERYSKVINSQVVSESGEQLGRVLGFSFDIETGELTTLVLGALGVPLLGEGVLSTWELAVEEIVSSGPDRIIVYEGAEEKLKQLGSGLLEKLGIGGPSWEQEERDRFRQPMVPVENQLTSGQPTAQEQRRIQPATSRALEPQRDEELEYVELDRRRQEPMRQRRYLDDQDDQAEPVRGGREPGRSGPGESEERSRQDRRYEDARYEDRRYEDRRFEDLDPPPFRATPAASERPLPRSAQPRSLQRRPPLDRQEEPLDVDPEPYQEPYQGPYDGPEAQPATFPVDRPERSGFEDPW